MSHTVYDVLVTLWELWVSHTVTQPQLLLALDYIPFAQSKCNQPCRTAWILFHLHVHCRLQPVQGTVSVSRI